MTARSARINAIRAVTDRAFQLVFAFQRGDLLLYGISDEFLTVTFFQYKPAEVVLGGLMTDLLECHINAAVQHGACNRHEDAEFFLRDNDSQPVRDIGDEADHLRSFPLEHLPVEN